MPAESDPFEVPATRPIFVSAGSEALRQGEIITGLVLRRLTLASIEQDTEDRLVEVQYPICAILTQDCDLEQDYVKREAGETGHTAVLPSILLCEVFEAEALRGRSLNSKEWSRIRVNNDERYHFLERVPRDQDGLGEGLPELGIDFKRYVTVPTGELYLRIRRGAVQRRCKLASPYLEHLSTRFAYDLHRVALPRQHESLPA